MEGAALRLGRRDGPLYIIEALSAVASEDRGRSTLARRVERDELKHQLLESAIKREIIKAEELRRKEKQRARAEADRARERREAEARERNTPRNRIMKDEALYAIAQSGPTSEDGLAQIRGVPKGFERSRAGKSLIEALKTAMSDPKAHAPEVEKRKPLPAGIGPTVELLKVLLRHVSEARGVSPRMIATVSDLEQIAAWDEPDVQALKGWRREVFGEEALKLKRGETALLIENGEVVTRPV